MLLVFGGQGQGCWSFVIWWMDPHNQEFSWVPHGFQCPTGYSMWQIYYLSLESTSINPTPKEGTGLFLAHAYILHEDVVLWGPILMMVNLLLNSPVKMVLGVSFFPQILTKTDIHLVRQVSLEQKSTSVFHLLLSTPVPSLTLFCPENSFLFH